MANRRGIGCLLNDDAAQHGGPQVASIYAKDALAGRESPACIHDQSSLRALKVRSRSRERRTNYRCRWLSFPIPHCCLVSDSVRPLIDCRPRSRQSAASILTGVPQKERRGGWGGSGSYIILGENACMSSGNLF